MAGGRLAVRILLRLRWRELSRLVGHDDRRVEDEEEDEEEKREAECALCGEDGSDKEATDMEGEGRGSQV